MIASWTITYVIYIFQYNFYVPFGNLHLGFVPVSDVDECANSSISNCHDNATCTNTEGGFTCDCNKGYAGNGTTCFGNIICMACLLC